MIIVDISYIMIMVSFYSCSNMLGILYLKLNRENLGATTLMSVYFGYFIFILFI